MRHWLSCALLGLALCGFCTRFAQADVIFQSAPDGPNVGVVFGSSVNQIAGVRFSVSNPVIVQSIGGDFEGRGTIFGAIIQLTGPTDFPDGWNPMNLDDILGHTLITLNQNTPSDVLTNIGPIFLNPGEYAVVFGSYQFGATGDGSVWGSGYGTDIGAPSYIFAGEGTSGFWRSVKGDGVNYLVEGVTVAPLPGIASAGLALMGVLIAGAAWRRLRKPRGA